MKTKTTALLMLFGVCASLMGAQVDEAYQTPDVEIREMPCTLEVRAFQHLDLVENSMEPQALADRLTAEHSFDTPRITKVYVRDVDLFKQYAGILSECGEHIDTIDILYTGPSPCSECGRESDFLAQSLERLNIKRIRKLKIRAKGQKYCYRWGYEESDDEKPVKIDDLTLLTSLEVIKNKDWGKLLKKLSFSRNSITNVGAQAIADARKGGKDLEERDSRHGWIMLRRPCDLAPGLYSLSEVSLTQTCVQNEGVRALMRTLTRQGSVIKYRNDGLHFKLKRKYSQGLWSRTEGWGFSFRYCQSWPKIRAFLEGSQLEEIISLNLGYCKIGDDGLYELLNLLKRKGGKIEKINLTENEITGESLRALARALQHENLKNLRELDLSYNKFSGDDCKVLVRTIPRLPSLSVLKLNTNIVGPTLKVPAFGIKNQTRERVTVKTGNWYHGLCGIQGIADFYCNGNSSDTDFHGSYKRHDEYPDAVGTLNLRNRRIRDAGMEALVPVLMHRSFEALHTLKLSYNELKDAGIQELAKVLKHPRTLDALEILDIRDNSFGEEGAQALFRALAGPNGPKKLRTLKISNGITPQTIDAFIAALCSPTLQNLEVLEINASRGNITEGVLIRLMDGLMQPDAPKKLHTLSFEWSKLKAASAPKIAEMLQHPNLRHLQELCLDHAKLGPEGAKIIAPALVGPNAPKDLHVFKMRDNQILDEGYAAMLEAFTHPEGPKKLVHIDLSHSWASELGVDATIEAIQHENLQELVLFWLDGNYGRGSYTSKCDACNPDDCDANGYCVHCRALSESEGIERAAFLHPKMKQVKDNECEWPDILIRPKRKAGVRIGC